MSGASVPLGGTSQEEIQRAYFRMSSVRAGGLNLTLIESTGILLKQHFITRDRPANGRYLDHAHKNRAPTFANNKLCRQLRMDKFSRVSPQPKAALQKGPPMDRWRMMRVSRRDSGRIFTQITGSPDPRTRAHACRTAGDR
jgi:hypothetical protein